MIDRFVSGLVSITVSLAPLFISTHANAGIVGDTVNATYYFPDASSPYSPYGDVPNAVVGSGIEFASGSNLYPYSYFDVDLSDGGVLVTFVQDAPYSGGRYWWESSISFNGLKLTNLTKSFDSSTFSSSTNTGFGESNFNWNGDTLSFNWRGVHFSPGDQIVITSTAPVPEPETYAMLLAGLGLLGLTARGRKQSQS